LRFFCAIIVIHTAIKGIRALQEYRDIAEGRSPNTGAAPGVKRNEALHRFSEISMSEEQRRRNPRYAFIASAELFEPVTKMKIATRVSELSLQGCYLDMLNPFPEDTIAQVKITAGDKVFETKVRVVYAHSNLGVGLVFLEPDPKNVEVLKSWIDEAKEDPARLLP